jgi:hypothetical protein
MVHSHVKIFTMRNDKLYVVLYLYVYFGLGIKSTEVHSLYFSIFSIK